MSSFANNCNDKVLVIYQNIITSIGNNSLYPPELFFSDGESDVAYMSSEGITIEQKAINLFCSQANFEDKMAYVIAHELAHYYLEHSWTSNTGLSYASSIGEFLEGSSVEDLLKTKKRDESQADLFLVLRVGQGQVPVSLWSHLELFRMWPEWPSCQV